MVIIILANQRFDQADIFDYVQIMLIVVCLHEIWKLGYNHVTYVFIKVMFIYMSIIFWYVVTTYGNYITVTLLFVLPIYCIFFDDDVLFLQWYILHGLKITFFGGTFTLHMEITLQSRFIFVRHCEVFFITSQLCYLFVRCSYVFYDVRITLYFGTFELRMEVTLKLRFVFVRHCEVFFITSQLCYFFVQCSYAF